MELAPRFTLMPVVKRVSEIPAGAGRWGEFLSAFLLGSWALGLWIDANDIEHWGALRVYVEAVGLTGALVWMTGVTLLVFISLVSKSLTLRFVAASLLVWSWASLLYLEILTGETYRPDWGTCIVGVLGAVNGSSRLWKRLSFRSSDK
jgi:hypothetical protein